MLEQICSLFWNMLQGLHELELVGEPQGRRQREESSALVKRGQRDRHVHQQRRDTKANL